jgi:hypothetical protein
MYWFAIALIYQRCKYLHTHMPKEAIPGSLAARIKTAMNERSVTPGKFARLFEIAPSVLNAWLRGDIPPIYEPMVTKWLYEGIGPTKADLLALRTGNKRQAKDKPKEPPRPTMVEAIEQTIVKFKGLIGSELTVEQMEDYGLTHCELEDIAAVHKISIHDLKDLLESKPELKQAYDAGNAAGRMALRKRQFEIAQSNNNSSGVMSIFLGKNYLNQADKPLVDPSETKPERIVYKWADPDADNTEQLPKKKNLEETATTKGSRVVVN